MSPPRSSRALRAALVLVGVALFQCSSSSFEPGKSGLTVDAGADAAHCYPDIDGNNGGGYTFVLTVDDTSFSKSILTSQNDAEARVTLTNTGTKPHGFVVGCTTTTAPAGCSTRVCFPSTATIAPLMPGETMTITFDTPTPDGITYPWGSSAPGDADVPGLQNLQWVMM